MKIVSWNVNGVNSRRRSLIKFLNSVITFEKKARKDGSRVLK